MILVFDLDDTLYDEMSYVRESFKLVAEFLSSKYNLPQNKVYNELLSYLETEGRGKVFNNWLLKYNIYSKQEVKRCVSIYRNTYPKIEISKEAKICLERFENWPKYLVTDGNKIVQSTKIAALNISRYFKKTIITHNYGKKNAKPSTYVFHKILSWEKKLTKDLVYIGDNPYKDFINLKKEGFHTIRVRTGHYKNINLSEEFEAEKSVSNLSKITFNLINSLKT